MEYFARDKKEKKAENVDFTVFLTETAFSIFFLYRLFLLILFF